MIVLKLLCLLLVALVVVAVYAAVMIAWMNGERLLPICVFVSAILTLLHVITIWPR